MLLTTAAMYRFYCPTLPPEPSASKKGPAIIFPLDRKQTHHARRVLRLEAGVLVEIFNGKGTICGGVLELGSNSGAVRITHCRHEPRPRLMIDIAVATPKSLRAADMANQLSQLGADRLVLLKTQRGVVLPRAAKLAHLDRVGIESAKQSQRAHLMHIEPPAALETVLARPHDLCLIADRTTDHTLQPGVPNLPDQVHAAGQVLILIGPEGGWTDQERHTATTAGAVPWSLGPNVLRIETAAVAAVAIVRHMASHTQPKKA